MICRCALYILVVMSCILMSGWGLKWKSLNSHILAMERPIIFILCVIMLFGKVYACNLYSITLLVIFWHKLGNWQWQHHHYILSWCTIYNSLDGLSQYIYCKRVIYLLEYRYQLAVGDQYNQMTSKTKLALQGATLLVHQDKTSPTCWFSNMKEFHFKSNNFNHTFNLKTLTTSFVGMKAIKNTVNQYLWFLRKLLTFTKDWELFHVLSKKVLIIRSAFGF